MRISVPAHPDKHRVLSVLLMLATLMGVWCCLVVLVCIFLTNNVGHLPVSLSHVTYSLVKCLSKSLPHWSKLCVFFTHVYFAYKSFVRQKCIFCEYFVPVYSLPFCYLSSIFQRVSFCFGLILKIKGNFFCGVFVLSKKSLSTYIFF